MDKYEVITFWNEEDQAFVAEATELPGCIAHGDKHGTALDTLRDAMELWIRTAREVNRPVPKLKGERLIFA
jgi:predicted RNase H-like HicB family nuclease